MNKRSLAFLLLCAFAIPGCSLNSNSETNTIVATGKKYHHTMWTLVMPSSTTCWYRLKQDKSKRDDSKFTPEALTQLLLTEKNVELLNRSGVTTEDIARGVKKVASKKDEGGILDKAMGFVGNLSKAMEGLTGSVGKLQTGFSQIQGAFSLAASDGRAGTTDPAAASGASTAPAPAAAPEAPAPAAPSGTGGGLLGGLVGTMVKTTTGLGAIQTSLGAVSEIGNLFKSFGGPSQEDKWKDGAVQTSAAEAITKNIQNADGVYEIDADEFELIAQGIKEGGKMASSGACPSVDRLRQEIQKALANPAAQRSQSEPALQAPAPAPQAPAASNNGGSNGE